MPLAIEKQFEAAVLDEARRFNDLNAADSRCIEQIGQAIAKAAHACFPPDLARGMVGEKQQRDAAARFAIMAINSERAAEIPGLQRYNPKPYR